MSLLFAFTAASCSAIKPPTLPIRALPSFSFTQSRCVSSSPYGRTHVWKHRQRKLPNPVVPQFPQRVIRADGSTFIHLTTSPRSVIRLTRDTTNNPLWNAAKFVGENEEEDEVTAALGRFNRRFDGLGGHGEEVDWMSGAPEASGAEAKVDLLEEHHAIFFASTYGAGGKPSSGATCRAILPYDTLSRESV
ncbi:hypothetical protein A0H81_06117 [Grifola frondosa]|uniref:50S ribosomal protein L31, chloroplastic n=1 Tax=Grifola frondosa TaxID=5627 RepID=A0A1C7MB79_GRIFR|nr:hypothetical protein A0H81_06117 [Grifola frondosa]